MNQEIELVLFDLGGVLIEISGSPLPVYEMQFSEWLSSETARKFEIGKLSRHEFANEVRTDLKLNKSVEEIISHFSDWPKGFYPGATDLLLSLSEKFRVGALSNTNEIHWPRIVDEFKAPVYFERIIASHEVGMAKPDTNFYIYALQEFGVQPQNVLFLDDSAKNVTVAKELGIESYLVRGMPEVLNVIEQLESAHV